MLIIDGLRHGAIYSRLVKMFPEVVLVYCGCDQETQIARLMNRDKISRGEAEEIIYHETELHIVELEPLANLFFSPGGSTENLLVQIDAIIRNE